jgi:hypothetical protein
MPYVNGKRFACDCGVSVFTKQEEIHGQEIFTCNGCQTKYVGTKKSRPA